MNPEFITQLDPPVLLENTEPLVVIKNEPLESEIMDNGIDDILDSSIKEIIPDIKDIDIVWHTLCDDSINETVPTNILETKHSENVKTQVLVKTENVNLVKIENITECENFNKTEETRTGNEQEVVNIQGNLDTDEQHVPNCSNDLNGISTWSRKPENLEKTDFAETRETTLWNEVNEKIKAIEALIIPVKPHEYTSLAEDKHVCNHCQQACKRLSSVKVHIKKKHRKVATLYQCPCCSFKSKWKSSLRLHIHKHKNTKTQTQNTAKYMSSANVFILV